MINGVEWALEWFREAKGVTATCDEHSTGVQSRVYLIRGAGDDEPLVLKQFNRDYEFNSPQAVQQEATALRLLTDSLRDIDGVDCPRVLAEAPDSWSYLMTFCRGRPLTDARPDAAAVTRLLLVMLDRYYESVSSPYCDLQPRNVLFGSGELYVLDPTLPNPLFDDLIEAKDPTRWAHADVGFWLHAVAARVARHPLEVRAHRWVHRMSTQLVARAAERFEPDDTKAFIEESFAVARFHARRFATLRRASRLTLPYKLVDLAVLERLAISQLKRHPAGAPQSVGSSIKR